MATTSPRAPCSCSASCHSSTCPLSGGILKYSGQNAGSRRVGRVHQRGLTSPSVAVRVSVSELLWPRWNSAWSQLLSCSTIHRDLYQVFQSCHSHLSRCVQNMVCV